MTAPKFALIMTMVVITIGMALFFGFARTLVDQRQNTINPGTPNPISQQAASARTGTRSRGLPLKRYKRVRPLPTLGK